MTQTQIDIAADLAAFIGGGLVALTIIDTLLSAIARTIGG